MALFDDYQAILFKRRGRVLEVTLNRPEKLNATDAVLHTELARVFVDINNDPDSDVVVLTGAGRAFSAGGDIGWMQEMIDRENGFDQTAREAKQIVFGLIDCEKPVICKMNGHATGLGATIALFCDVIFAAEHAKIGDPHVSIGFVAGDGGAVIWPQLIGYARAKEYLLTGDMMTAHQAAQMGLINHAVPADELDARVDAFADKLVAGATQAIRWTKMSVNIGLRDLATSIMDASLAYEARSNDTPDHQEAVRAFAEKRAPVFGHAKAAA
ncbi:MAG: enoyl-CoA hydratase [Sphingomonas bacterium]|uniref:enoyl-CoA hydratase/isomerase family protein n=1 Tax=Sphingomonas bacterium TaxID=1895847 RepID=UPI0026026C40|nr:enoyl-CoA hydratase-related protein [Sphingomonas bacterium]MDB5712394.1 enoyl-CoA hydratase [Sphingomonas bacterium]